MDRIRMPEEKCRKIYIAYLKGTGIRGRPQSWCAKYVTKDDDELLQMKYWKMVTENRERWEIQVH